MPNRLWSGSFGSQANDEVVDLLGQDLTFVFEVQIFQRLERFGSVLCDLSCYLFFSNGV
jgi:hypothetical protein